MRDGAVDGLRGWAALMVVCYHFTWERLGARYPILRNPVTAWFLNGDFAVSIFFVLSGIALTSGYFTNGDRRILVGLAVKRYSRLTIPILVTCFLTFALYQLGLTYCGSASVVVARPDWIGSWLSEPVTLLRWAQDRMSAACSLLLMPKGSCSSTRLCGSASWVRQPEAEEPFSKT